MPELLPDDRPHWDSESLFGYADRLFEGFGDKIDYINAVKAKNECFHEETIFHERDRGAVAVANLNIGDHILVWNDASSQTVYSQIAAWWIQPSNNQANNAACPQSMEWYIRVHFSGSSMTGSITLTPTHHVEMRCRSEQFRHPRDGPSVISPSLCSVKADQVQVGDQLPFSSVATSGSSSSTELVLVTAVERFSGGGSYTPLTRMGMHFVVGGGVIVPLDGTAQVRNGSLLRAANRTLAEQTYLSNEISRSNVLKASQVVFQSWEVLRRMMPMQWMAAWEAHLLAREPSIVSPCSDTIAAANMLIRAIETDASLAQLVADRIAAISWTMWLGTHGCRVFPRWCSVDSERIIVVANFTEHETEALFALPEDSNPNATADSALIVSSRYAAASVIVGLDVFAWNATVALGEPLAGDYAPIPGTESLAGDYAPIPGTVEGGGGSETAGTSGLSIGAVVGIILGSCAGVLALAVIMLVLRRRKTSIRPVEDDPAVKKQASG